MGTVPVTEPNTCSVQDAFSRQSAQFDAIEQGSRSHQWIRRRVRAQAMRYMRPGERLLELNAGTGIDSAFFAGHGIVVTATDNAPGMLRQLRAKAAPFQPGQFRVIDRSFHDLDQFGEERFHHVFSNFGGLNCTDRLGEVLAAVEERLLPGGTATLVIMPHVSPWELVELLRGHAGIAFRRFGSRGALAQVEGVPFRCWYYSARYVRRHMPGCSTVVCRALALFVPPPHLQAFADRHPLMVNALERLETWSAGMPAWRGAGDHFMITLRKRPA